MHISQRLTAGVLAGALLAGGAAGAFAAPAQRAHGNVAFAIGQVSNLTATGFTLTRTGKATTTGAAAPTKTIQVTIDANTKETARKGTTGPLVSGDYALVVGQKSSTGLAATHILYSSTPFKARNVLRKLGHRVAGTVTGSTPTSLTIQTRRGSLTFSITTDTQFRANGQLLTVAPTFTTGERVVVRYTRDKVTKTLTALVVTIAPTKTS